MYTFHFQSNAMRWEVQYTIQTIIMSPSSTQPMKQNGCVKYRMLKYNYIRIYSWFIDIIANHCSTSQFIPSKHGSWIIASIIIKQQITCTSVYFFVRLLWRARPPHWLPAAMDLQRIVIHRSSQQWRQTVNVALLMQTVIPEDVFWHLAELL